MSVGSGVTGIPGANAGGTQMQVPTTGSQPVPAIGGQQNPLIPGFPSGQNMPGASNPIAGLDPSKILGGGSKFGGMNVNDIKRAFMKAGYSAGDAYLIAQFLGSGAGFNPQVAQAMLAALNPQIERGQANILEQFSAGGLRESSPAAIGLGDYMSQVYLDQGQILSQMYEQAVQNYMEVMLAGRKPQQQGGGMAGIGSLFGGAGQLAGGISSLIPSASSGASTAADVASVIGTAAV